jgi:polyisoprenoid-binding protein YceI
MRVPIILVVLFVPFLPAAAGDATLHTLTDESSITYTVVHPLHTIEATSREAVYHLDADTSNKEIRSVSAGVDVMTFDSGNSNRDSHAMEVVDALTYPEASFSSDSVTEQGDSLTVSGKLTFHGVTKEIVMIGTALWSAGRLDVNGSFTVTMTEFNIERPSVLMVPVHDEIDFTVKAVFTW